MPEINPRLLGYAALRQFGRAFYVAGALFAFLALLSWLAPIYLGVSLTELVIVLLAVAFGSTLAGAIVLERTNEVLVMTLLDAAVGGVAKRREH